MQWSSSVVEDFFKKRLNTFPVRRAIHTFQRFLALQWDPFQISSSRLLLQKPLIIFVAGKTSVKSFGKLRMKKAHTSTKFTNRKWEIKPAQYYLKRQNVLIIDGIWLETIRSWSPAVSISRARLLQEFSNLPTLQPLHEPQKKVKS